MIFKPLTLKPAVLAVSLAIMLGSVGLAQHLKPSKYWAVHTGEPDYDKLNSFATLSNDITCYIVLKVNRLPEQLKPEQRGPYARYILGN